MSQSRFAAEPLTVGWYLYRFETDLRCPLGCAPGTHPLYRGKSNEPLRRLLEHAKDQPWWPYVTGWSVNPEVYASNEDVLAAERAAILAELPLGNKEHNWRNPHRIDFGQPVSSVPRARAKRPPRQPVAVPARRSWSRGQRRAAVLVGLWLAVAVGLWLVTGDAGWNGLMAGAGGASGAFVAAWVGKPKRRRRGKR